MIIQHPYKVQFCEVANFNLKLQNKNYVRSEIQNIYVYCVTGVNTWSVQSCKILFKIKYLKIFIKQIAFVYQYQTSSQQL